ncbi:1470_t:CDS:2, partial [Entrophospora sp. SA101]
LRLYGTLQYSDPQYLKNLNGYTHDKKSDIYSIGILFWEISSEKIPFESEISTGFSFVFSIVNGKREEIIEGSPRNLYNRVCDITEKLLNDTAEKSYFPTSVTAIHALVYTFVHTLVIISPIVSEKTEEASRLIKMINGFLVRLAAGTLVAIDPDEATVGYSHIQIQNYNSLAQCIFLEGLVKCLLVKDVQLRRFVMENLLMKHWILPDQTMTSLYEHVVQLFSQAAFEMLSDPKSSIIDQNNPFSSLPYLILNILYNKLPPKDLRRMSPQVIRSLISVLVSIFTLSWPELAPQRSSSLSTPNATDNHSSSSSFTQRVPKQTDIEILSLAKKYVEDLWNEGWKMEVIELVKETFQQDSLERIIAVLDQLVFGINDTMGNDIKIISTQPETSPNLKKLLLSLCTKHRQHFYKPILACVASDSESKIASHLHLIATLQKYLSPVELFMQDVEFMSVIILSDVGPGITKTAGNSHDLTSTAPNSTSKCVWGSTTLGQCVIVMEFVWIIRELRLNNSGVRWLSRIIDWMSYSAPGAAIYRDSIIQLNKLNNPFKLFSEPEVDNNQLNEVEWIFQRIRVVYANLEDYNSNDSNQGDQMDVPVPFIPIPLSTTTPHTPTTPKTPLTQYSELKRHSTIIVSNTTINHPLRSSSKLPTHRLHRFNNFNEDPAGSVLSLLVAVFSTLTSEEYVKIAPRLWDRFLNDREHQPFASASFLFIQCGEKAYKIVKNLIMKDLYSTNALTRAITIRKISSLFGHRSQLLSQPYVSDSNRRRPFRSQAPAIPFVPTELGTSEMMMYEYYRGLSNKNDNKLSTDVKKRIQELGWEEEEGEGLENLKRITTPISLIPTFYLDEEEMKNKEESNILHSHEKIKRNIRGNHPNNNMQSNANKRRTASILILSSFSLRLVDLLDDLHGGVFNLTKEIIIYFLRDDPLLFLRIFFSELGTINFEAQKELLTKIHFLISMQHVFPSGFSHTLFNHLAGILKWYSRDNKSNGLGLMTYVIPILAEIVPTVNDLLVRDFRKNKIENILCNNGQFWFTDGSPLDMFPRNLTNDQVTFQILDVPLVMFQVAILRIGHIHFMTNFVIKCPHEVYSVKKMIQAYIPMPSTNASEDSICGLNEDEYYLPDIKKSKGHTSEFSNPSTRRKKDVKLLSALRARTWLKFLLVMLERLNRNYNDRNELNIFLNGANRILLENADDFGIVGQTLILYTTTVTRFHRLFDANRGYSIFIPALFKVFCESEKIPPIRSAIIFAWCKFFRIHGESFIFQALGCLTPLILKGSIKSTKLCEWMSLSLYELFKALNFPVNQGDSLGIHDIVDELETVDTLFSDPLPLFSGTFKKRANSMASKAKSGLLGTQEEKIFSLEDLVRLFMTIIAYDPGSLRAEQFVQILQYLVPHLLQESSSIRTLVDDGMAALTEVFLKFSKSSKPIINSMGNINNTNIYNSENGNKNESMDNLNIDNNDLHISEATAQAFGKQWQQNDRMTIKRNFLVLVQKYKKYGGILSENSHSKLANMICLMIKDYAAAKKKISTNFLKDYIKDALLFNTTFEDGRKRITSLIRQVAPSFRQHYKSIDFSGFIDGLVLIVTDKLKFTMNDHTMASFIKEKYISFGLSVALRPDREDGEPMQLHLCQSLVDLFVSMMVYSDQDILSELDRYLPTHQLIAYVLIPICLQYKPEDSVFMPLPSKNDSHKSKAADCWIRILYFITKACNKGIVLRSKTTSFGFRSTSNISNPITDNKDENEENNSGKVVSITAESTATFILSFIALKILLVRAEKYITHTKGMWVHIAQFIRQMLNFAGTASLSQKSKTAMISSGSTPATSMPNLHANNDISETTNDRNSFNPNSRSIFLSSTQDFVLWAFLELILYYKLPINLYMRTFIHQKLQQAVLFTNGMHHKGSSNDNSNRQSSPIMASDSRRSRWKSWGGPPAGNQQILRDISGTSYEAKKYSSVRSRNENESNVNNINCNQNGSFTSPSGMINNNMINNLINETFNSYSNVHTLMGYGGYVTNVDDSAQELRSWSYSQVLDKLREEKKLVMDTYKNIFNSTSLNEGAGNHINIDVNNTGDL